MVEMELAIEKLENGNIEEGLTLLNNVLKKADHGMRFEISTYLYQLGYTDEAKKIIDELIQIFPGEGELLVFSAEIDIELGKEDEALEKLHQVNKDDAEYLRALFLIADIYQLQGLDEAAESKLFEAKEVAPNEVIIDFGLAEFYASRGEYHNSLTYYEKVLKNKKSTIGEQNVNLLYAQALMMCANFEEALIYFEAGLKEKTDIPSLFGYGFTAFQIEQYQLAIKNFTELKELDPEYPSLHNYLARAYEFDGQINEAFHIMEQGTKINDTNKEDFLYHGKLAIKLNNPQVAKQSFKQAIALDPGFVECVLAYIAILIEEQKFDEALSVLTKSIEQGEYDPQFEWDLATINRNLENYSDALNNFHTAYNYFKENTSFLEEYAFFLLEEGERQKALDILKEILRLNPTLIHIEEELLRLEEHF